MVVIIIKEYDLQSEKYWAIIPGKIYWAKQSIGGLVIHPSLLRTAPIYTHCLGIIVNTASFHSVMDDMVFLVIGQVLTAQLRQKGAGTSINQLSPGEESRRVLASPELLMLSSQQVSCLLI